MIAVIDSCSLLSLARYYLPFDVDGVLFNYIRRKIETGEVIVIDKVLEECIYNAKGIVISTLSYLSDPTFLKSAKVLLNTDSLLPKSPVRFFRQVETQFVNSSMRNKLAVSEYEVEKNRFFEGADLRQIILCENMQNEGKEVVLVTEESAINNDNKLFKKIPSICKELSIKTQTLPDFLMTSEEIGIDFSLIV